MNNMMIRVAARENNNKRAYLVVNTLQGKHFPASPLDAMQMFCCLAKQVTSNHKDERLLVIGFAETATAIGAAIAIYGNCWYIQTTREVLSGCDYLYFTEAHSHATEQKLVKDDLTKILPDIDRIVFAEDELTTGHTILNAVHVLRQSFGTKIQFSAASLVNGMSQQARAAFALHGITLYQLLQSDFSDYTSQALTYQRNGCSYPPLVGTENLDTLTATYVGYLDARRLLFAKTYDTACVTLWEQMQSNFKIVKGSDLLVLGTEEFMYPALYAACQMERLGAMVKFHATTRSPIAVSREEDYPFHVRHQLVSMYDNTRVTFLYELRTYEQVFIITDAPREQTAGLQSLLAALRQAGNETIHVIRWCPS